MFNPRILSMSRRPRAWSWAIAAAAAGIVAALAFGQLFTTFAAFDDEGYFFQLYRHFLSGRVLYDQLISIYGPMAFFCGALVARFHPDSVTHDVFRWATLPLWVLIAFLLAAVVWSWTGKTSPSLIAFLLTGYGLKNLASDIAHPQLWIIVAVAMLLALGLDWLWRPRENMRALWAGILLGAVLLIKINIGIFLCVGVALAIGLHMKGWTPIVFCGIPLLAAAVFGIALLFTTPFRSEVYFALAYLASLAVTVGLAIGQPGLPAPRPAALVWLIAGACGCVSLVILLTLAMGTTLSSLISDLVLFPARFAATFHSQFREPGGWRHALFYAAAGVAALAYWRPPHFVRERADWIGVLKFAVGSALVFSFWYNNRIALTPSLLFLWLLVADRRPSEPGYSNRLLLAVLSPLFSLQLYPIAGSQVDWAGLLPMTAAAILMADGIDCLQRAGIASALRLAAAARGITALIVLLLFAFTGVEAARSLAEWRRNPSLEVAGAHWLHLPPADHARLHTTVAAISRNCQEVLTVPRMPSFSLWSEVPMVEPKRITSGPEDVREEEVRKVREHEGGCVLVSPNTYLFWREIRGDTNADRLLPEIEKTMNSISSVPDVDPLLLLGEIVRTVNSFSSVHNLTLYRSNSTGDQADATGHLLK
jgi:hypothetical protein